MPVNTGIDVRFTISIGLTFNVDATTIITAATGETERIKFAVNCIGKATNTVLTPICSVISGMILMKE